MMYTYTYHNTIHLLWTLIAGFGSGQSSSFTFDDSRKSTEPSNGLISVELGNNILESNGVQQIAKPPKYVSPSM